MSQPHANPDFVAQALARQIRVLIADMRKHNMSALGLADLETIADRLEARRG
jgi:predicted transcriptional regulator